jgi:hypothetical protein
MFEPYIIIIETQYVVVFLFGFPFWLLISHVLNAGGSMITIRCAVIVAGVPCRAVSAPHGEN